jgi:hypothetical protein
LPSCLVGIEACVRRRIIGHANFRRSAIPCA